MLITPYVDFGTNTVNSTSLLKIDYKPYEISFFGKKLFVNLNK